MMAAPLLLKDRIENGRRARERARRRHHENPGILNRDPIALLEATCAGRVAQLVPLHYGRMRASPFTFFRGSAALQAHDLSGTPDSGFIVTACGDCHLSNIGGFATPERNLLLDLNDFDETHPAPWEWDLKRLTTSFVIAARHLRHGESVAETAAFRVARSYQQRMKAYANMNTLDVWYDKITFERLLESTREHKEEAAKIIRRGIIRAEHRTQEALLPKMASHEEGRWIIHDDPPSLFHMHGATTLLSTEDDWLRAGNWQSIVNTLLGSYKKTLPADRRILLERYTMQDLAFKVVGVGSVGTRSLILLLVDPHESPLFLQIKEATASVLAPYVNAKSPWRHQGRRVVEGQRLLQSASDLFLGWGSGPSGRHFYIRQLRDMKISPDIENFDSELLLEYADISGWILARAHAKASGLAPEISGYLGDSQSMAEALTRYAKNYADQVEKDFDVFTKACRKGRLKARSDTDYEQDFYVR
jgi:uncharacterized protein (DUF2252 family)